MKLKFINILFINILHPVVKDDRNQIKISI